MLHSSVRRPQDISVAEALTCVIPLEVWRARYRCTPMPIARMPHSPICSATATNHNCATRLSQRGDSCSMPSPTSTASTRTSARLVPSSTSTTASATTLWVWVAQLLARPVSRCSKVMMAKKVTTATVAATKRLHNGTPAKVVSWIQSMKGDEIMQQRSSS